MLPREGLLENCVEVFKKEQESISQERKRGRYLCKFCKQDQQYSQQLY